MSGKRAKQQRSQLAAVGASAAGPKTRPSRSTTLPDAPTDRTLDYAKSRVELKGMCPGDIVLAFEATHAWQQVMVPIIDGVEERRRAPLPGESKRRGNPSQYTAHDFERMELLRRVLGKTSTLKTRDWLTGDRAKRTRELFGLDRDRRVVGGKARVLMAGIPCDGTMSDYRVKYFNTEERSPRQVLQHRGALRRVPAAGTVPAGREAARVPVGAG